MATNNPGLQVNAFQALNSYAALAAQINNVLSTIATLKQAEAAHAYSVIYANTATYAVNPDGSPGAQDSSPNLSHPMSGQYISANQVDGFVGYVVNDLYNFLTGVAGPTVSDRRPAITGMLP